ncbi:MAG: hypothetical protein AAF581_14150 [Planctomycetota bacterium]
MKKWMLMIFVAALFGCTEAKNMADNLGVNLDRKPDEVRKEAAAMDKTELTAIVDKYRGLIADKEKQVGDLLGDAKSKLDGVMGGSGDKVKEGVDKLKDGGAALKEQIVKLKEQLEIYVAELGKK